MGYKPTSDEHFDNLLILFALLISAALIFALFCGFFWLYERIGDISTVAATIVQAHPVAAPAAALTCICMTPAVLFMLFAIHHRHSESKAAG